MKHLEVLRAELERLFELNELLTLSQDVLGFDPERVGGQANLSSFAGALIAHCEKEDATLALLEAVVASGHDLSPGLVKATSLVSAEESSLQVGDELADFRIVRKLHDDRFGSTYFAKGPQGDVRLKVLHPETCRDRRGLQRYLSVTRMCGALSDLGFPSLVFAGEVAHRFVVAHKYVEGQPLSARVGRTGPMHINEARPLLQSIVESLIALHDKRLVHGALSLENVMTYRADGGQAVVLMDAAVDRLTAPDLAEPTGLRNIGGSINTVAPEQLRGGAREKATDVYSLGAVIYELLTGRSLFAGGTLDIAYSHLTAQPTPPSQVAPRGWVTPDIDELVLRLVRKIPSERGALRDVLTALDDLGRAKKTSDIAPNQVEELEHQLLNAPDDTEVAMALEATVGRGATAEQVGQAFRLAASMIDDPVFFDEKRGLLIRAARLMEQSETTLERAETIYEDLLALDPRDAIALAGLEEVRRRAGKFEELVEMLLARAEHAPGNVERARAMNEIGRVYFFELEDNEQAVIAFAQAYCDDPQPEYASGVERAAGTAEPLWAEALQAVGEATTNETLAPEACTQLMLQAGIWYQEKLSRADLAIPCFQAVLAAEPANERALDMMCRIYQKAQQWQELGAMLTHRANAAPTPAGARELRVQSAEILEHRLGDVAGARAIYELILSEDPTHDKAADALSRILEKSGDFDILVRLLASQIDTLPADAAVRTICRIGEIYDEQLNNPTEAAKMYRRALEQDPQSLDPLRGLERLYSKQGKYQEVLENLEVQVSLSATPKQRIALLERIAAIQEEEFLNHEAAARALERALMADAGRLSAMSNLVRHLRVLERWEEASQLYERQLALVQEPAARVALGMAWGRLLAEQLGSPERAMHAYELVIGEDPEHAGALEALARLREAAGDADQALSAILALAEKAETPAARAEQYVRAARLQQSRGNRDAAIEHYRHALDAQPENRTISAALRDAYVKRGDINAAVELLEREIDATEGDLAQARLAGEMARLQRDGLKDDARAEATAKRALQLDPGNAEALLVLGDVAFEKQRHVEASAHYGRLVERIESLGEDRAIHMLIRYVDALSKSNSTESALAAMDTLLRLAPNDAAAYGRVAQVVFEHGAPRRAVEILYHYLTHFSDQLSERERSISTYRLGEAYRRSGDLERAVLTLRDAIEYDPGAEAALESLGAAYVEQENFAEAVRIKTEHLDLLSGEKRVDLLMDIADIWATKLGDRTQAARSYVAALEERPEDRRLLTKLMQLYSEDKDWNKLIEVVVKLAEFVDDPKQKAKYLHTAALVSARQTGDVRAAADYFEQVLELQPENPTALKELVELQRQSGNYAEVEDLLKRRLAAVEDNATKIAIYDQLGELYQTHLVAPDLAAEAYESANEFDPNNRDRLAKLAAIYESDPETFQVKGIELQEQLLSQNPYRHESYKSLRKIYTVTRNADASWVLCQALSVLRLAEPDEQRFYERMRAETAAPAQAIFTEQDWAALTHPRLDPLLTAVFALIQPAVVMSRAQPLANLGLNEQMLVDPSQHHSTLAQTLYYAAGVLGVDLPAVFANPNDQGGLTHMMTSHPSLSMGRVGMSSQIPPQVAAFVAAQQLAYLRPGMYLRHFIQTGTGLKAWLFAAIKLISPQFPIAPDLEGSVTEALAALRANLAIDAKDHLSSVVSKLIQSGTALDLKKWIAAVDLTTDRAGLVVAHDLQTVTEVVRASDEYTSTVPQDERLKELVLFSVSAKYLKIRRALGIAVDS